MENMRNFEQEPGQVDYKFNPVTKEDWERILEEVKNGTFKAEHNAYGIKIKQGDKIVLGKWVDLSKVNDKYKTQGTENDELVFTDLDPNELDKIYDMTGFEKPFPRPPVLESIDDTEDKGPFY